MVLYTIVPPEFLFDDDDPEEVVPVKAAVNGVPVLVVPTGEGKGRIERLLSTDPDHFLDPLFQPGTVVSLDSN